jgi:hypothetical protein
VSTLAAVGFASDDLDDGIDDGVQDRTAELVTDYWNWFPQRACNGDIQIHEGETTQVEECLIFDFANGGLSARAVSEDSDGDGIPDTPTDEFNVVPSKRTATSSTVTATCCARRSGAIRWAASRCGRRMGPCCTPWSAISCSTVT